MITKAKLCKDSITGEIISLLITMDDEKIWAVPFDPANTDYQAFLKYKEEGGKVYGPDEEVPTGG